MSLPLSSLRQVRNSTFFLSLKTLQKILQALESFVNVWGNKGSKFKLILQHNIDFATEEQFVSKNFKQQSHKFWHFSKKNPL